MAVKPGYKQTEVGAIPEEWALKAVEDSFDVCNHLRLPLSQAVRERMAGQYPYYGPTSVQGWINEYRVEGEYALIGEDGDHFLKWQTQPMTLLVRGKFNVNNHAHLVQGTRNLTEWFYWFFANRDLTPYLTRQGAGRYKLTKAALLKMPCALPPKAEQLAITQALNDIDMLVSGIGRFIAKKRNLKQGAMEQLLTGKTRLPGFHRGWELKTLEEIAAISKGTQLHSSKTKQNGLFPHYNGGVSPSSYTDKFNTLANTIAISEGGNSCGYVQLVLQPFWCGGHCYAVVPKTTDNQFLYYALKGMQYAIMALRVGSGLPNVQKTALAAFKVSIPGDPEEQTAIADVLTDFDNELAALEQWREKARALKQAMMQELLTGNTRLV
jgi:type I restriction enzyme S subunit